MEPPWALIYGHFGAQRRRPPLTGVWLPRGPVPAEAECEAGSQGAAELRDPAVSTGRGHIEAGGGTFKETRAEVPFRPHSGLKFPGD